MGYYRAACSHGKSGSGHDSPCDDANCGVLLVERVRQLLPGGDQGSPLLVGLQHQSIPLLRHAGASHSCSPVLVVLA